MVLLLLLPVIVQADSFRLNVAKTTDKVEIEAHHVMLDKFLLEISVGNPPKPFMTTMDSSVDGFVIPKTGCRYNRSTCSECDSVLYDPLESYTGDSEEGFITTSINNNKIEGEVFKDIITVGDLDELSLCTFKTSGQHAFLAATRMDALSNPTLGFPSSTDSESPSVFHRVLEDANLDNPYLSLHYRTCADEDCIDAGSALLGSLDKDNCVEDVTWAPLNGKSSRWLFDIEDVEINGQPVAPKAHPAMSRTASAVVKFPKLIFDKIMLALSPSLLKNVGDAFYSVKCDSVIELVFKISGIKHFITQRELLSVVYGYDYCRLNVEISYSGAVEIGAPFLKAYCHIYDLKSRRIGFSKQKSIAPINRNKRRKIK